jgi:adenylosuccinate lyase
MTSILLDEMLETMIKIIGNLQVNTKRVQKNLHITSGQIFAEFVLEALIKKGMPRFEAYKNVQRVAFAASKKETDYVDAVKNDKVISSYLSDSEIKSIFVPEKHLGASLNIIENVSKHVSTNSKKFF